jgi:RHS repeat-associated protein
MDILLVGTPVLLIRHSDSLGSSRFASTVTPPTGKYFDVAYAPYGEDYADSGTKDLSFTGQNQDLVSGLYDFLYRKYNPVHGRWLSPDPLGLGAANPASPQSWNRYAYVGGYPLSVIDRLGLCGDDGDPCEIPPIIIDVSATAPNPIAGIVADLPNEIPLPPSPPIWVPPTVINVTATPCPPVPQSPPGAKVDRNIRISQLMRVVTYTDPALSLYVFKKTVGNQMPWDYKQQGWTMTDTGQLGPSPFQDFGNFNFGATGAAWGIPLDVLLRAAGYAQVQAGTSTPEWGHWYQGPPHGDDPNDQAQIIAGFQYYQDGCNE